MRRALRIAAFAGAVVAVAGAVFAIPTLWGKPWSIDHFYTRVFLEYGLRHPMLLSQLRVLEPYGLRSHNRELDDFSVAAEQAEVDAARRNLRTLRSYAPEAQSADQRFSSAVLDWLLQITVDGEPFQLYDYPLNQLDGVQIELPEFMTQIHTLRDARDAEDYVARLSRIGGAIDQAIASQRTRVERGLLPPRFVVQRVRGQVETFRAGGADANVLVTSFAERLGRIEGLAPESRAQLVAAARAEVETSVLPAYQRLADYLPELEAEATDDIGAWKDPEGSLYYGWALRYHTTTRLSADEIHALGVQEVARIQEEIRPILASEGRDTGAIGPALRALHADPSFLYSDDDAGRAQVLADYRAILDDAAPRLPALFGRLPQAQLRVERVPAFKEASAPGAYYEPAPLDGSRPAVFYVNLRSVREIPRFGMRTLAYHEGIPGHHLQIALAQERTDLPLFRRVVPMSAYTEGWALYAEHLALEQGFHPTPLDRLGALVAELFRAARLVVDTGIHAERWTRQQAIDYMLENTGMPETDVIAEVERYVVSPGQACAYKVGELEILQLRERARQALGDRFDLRAFHDLVLGQGALPLELLDQVVDAWIAQQGAAPGSSGRAERP